MKRTIAFILSLILTISCTACGTQSEQIDRTDETGTTGDIIIDENGGISGDILYNSYRVKASPELMPNLEDGVAVGKYVFQSYYDDAYHNMMTSWYHTETMETGKLLASCAKDKVASHNHSQYILRWHDGRIALLCTTTVNIDEYTTEIVGSCIELYDENLQYQETIEIPEEVSNGNFLNNRRFSVDAEGNYYLFTFDSQTQTQTLECYNKDFEHYGNINYPTNLTVPGLFQGANGEVYLSLAQEGYKYSGTEYYKIYRLDAKDRTCTEFAKPIAPEGWVGPSFCGGFGDYDFFYCDSYGIHGVSQSGTTCVVNFINSDIPVGSVLSFSPLENGDFHIHTINTDDFNDHQYSVITQRTPEEFENTELVTLSTVGMYDSLEEIVINFNRQESGVRIILQDYANYNTPEDDTLGHAKMREDMLDGILADMVCTDGLNFESLAGKGLFADWYDLMDADEEFNRGDYLENYFESMEYGGKLQKMGVSFHLMTAVAKTEFAGDKQGRTLAEFMAQPLAENMNLFHFYNQDYAMQFWFNAAQASFIDRKNARCYFDTPEFVQLLEMLKACSTDEYGGIWTPTLIGEQPPVDSMAFQENRALVDFITITRPIDYHNTLRTVFDDAPLTIIGYPTAEENAGGGVFRSDFTLSVNAQSEKKDAVWAFMKYLLSEKYQKKCNGPMPIHKGILQEKLTLATKLVGERTWFNDTMVNVGAASPESMDMLSAYIDTVNTSYYCDATVEQVLQEETEMFLAGDQTAQQAAKMMQSRIGLYLSEQS